MTIRCEKCKRNLYQGQCVNPKCPSFSADAAIDWVEDELLPDMCLDFEGFAARQVSDEAPSAALVDHPASSAHQTPVDGADR